MKEPIVEKRLRERPAKSTLGKGEIPMNNSGTVARVLVFALGLLLLVVASCKGAWFSSPPELPKNRAPLISSINLSSTIAGGESTAVSCSARDPDGDTLTYIWSATHGSFTGSGSRVAFNAPTVDSDTDVTISVVIRDGQGGADSAIVSITVTVSEPSPDPPHITDVQPRSGMAGDEVTFSATVEGTPSSTYFWDFGGGAKPNDSTAESPTVTLGNAGSYNANLTVSFELGEYTYHFTLTVSETDPGGGSQIVTVDSVDQIGSYTSIALDSSDNPHISYWGSNHGLRYAHFDGESWQKETVARGGWGSLFTSIAIDSFDNPHVMFGPLYAHLDGVSWEIESVGGFAGYSTLALDSTDTPHIVSSGDGLYYAYRDELSWQTIKLESSSKLYNVSSMALDSEDNPHISYSIDGYSDGWYADLRYAYFDGVSWHKVNVDSDGDVGRESSIALDSSGNPHISYRDDTNSHLKYAYYNGTAWRIETAYAEGGSGLWTSIALDSADNPHISHWGMNLGLKYTHFDGASWQTETVNSGVSVGWATSIAIDSLDHPHISYTDYVSNELKYAHLTGD